MFLYIGKWYDRRNGEDVGDCVLIEQKPKKGAGKTTVDARGGRVEGDMMEWKESRETEQGTTDDVNETVGGNDKFRKKGICSDADRKTYVNAMIFCVKGKE